MSMLEENDGIRPSIVGGYSDRAAGACVDILKSGIMVLDDVDMDEAQKSALALQTAWRSKCAKKYVAALKQQTNCKYFRKTHPEIVQGNRMVFLECETCRQGEAEEEKIKVLNKKKYQELERILDYYQPRGTVEDTGANWNKQFQAILELPETTKLDRRRKFALLSKLNQDFVSTAKQYAKTIISEYFLHADNKIIVAKPLGGIAGGKKYCFRGILFKLADGSQEPWNGSDEAASKAAGHDLKGSMFYFNAGIKKLNFPLMALIDYKGFRMTAQALLPIKPGARSIIYGSSDAGRTIHFKNSEFNKCMEEAAAVLNIAKHEVGEPGHQISLSSALDIEGHFGIDSRFYLLDASRAFPPESPNHTHHLDYIFEDGSDVLVRIKDIDSGDYFTACGRIHKAHIIQKEENETAGRQEVFYDVLFDADGSILQRLPADSIISKSKRLSVFHRLLRPEYVKYRGAHLVELKHEDLESREIVREDQNFLTAACSAQYDTLNDSESYYYGTSAFTSSYVGSGLVDPYGAFESNNVISSELIGNNYGSFENSQDIHSESSIPTPIDQVNNFTAESADFLAACFESLMKFDSKSLSHLKFLKEVKQQTISNDSLSKKPVPLSPDAHTAFSRFGRDALQRNRDVDRATQRLIEEIIPAVAKLLASLSKEEVVALNLPVYLHSHGINLRHMGLLKSMMPNTIEAVPIRTLLLVQITARTLKNLAKEYQRRWLRSERTTSETGILFLLSQFLNLIVGSHVNSDDFWQNQVIVGIIQRFGACAINNSPKLILDLRRFPAFIKLIVELFARMIGIVLKDSSHVEFFSCESTSKFEFFIHDFESLEPKVKCLHLVDFSAATLLMDYAEDISVSIDSHSKEEVVDRLHLLAIDRFNEAEMNNPTHLKTIDGIINVKVAESLGESVVDLERRSLSNSNIDLGFLQPEAIASIASLSLIELNVDDDGIVPSAKSSSEPKNTNEAISPLHSELCSPQKASRVDTDPRNANDDKSQQQSQQSASSASGTSIERAPLVQNDSTTNEKQCCNIL